MKKLLSLAIALLLAFSLFCASAFAETEDIDLSGYSTEELMALFAAVRSEITARFDLVDNNAIIGRGNYTVGRDIRAGRFVLTVYETEVYSFDGSPDNTVSIIATDENGDDDYITTNYDSPVGAIIVVSLTEGQTLHISGCSCTIAEAGNAFWAP